MFNDIPGKLIGLLLAFVLTVVAPFVNTTVMEELIDRRAIVTDVTTFIDEVIDSREITESMIKELNTNVSSYSVNVDYEVRHYRRSVNPDPLGETDFYVSYIEMNDTDDLTTTDWQKGDRISVRVRTIGYSTVQTIAHKLAFLFIPELDRTFTARIR